MQRIQIRASTMHKHALDWNQVSPLSILALDASKLSFQYIIHHLIFRILFHAFGIQIKIISAIPSSLHTMQHRLSSWSLFIVRTFHFSGFKKSKLSKVFKGFWFLTFGYFNHPQDTWVRSMGLEQNWFSKLSVKVVAKRFVFTLNYFLMRKHL